MAGSGWPKHYTYRERIVTFVSSFLLIAWVHAVALKEDNYPLLYFYINGRDQVATARDGYICYGGTKV
jgi:hypothetical protein